MHCEQKKDDVDAMCCICANCIYVIFIKDKHEEYLEYHISATNRSHVLMRKGRNMFENMPLFVKLMDLSKYWSKKSENIAPRHEMC